MAWTTKQDSPSLSQSESIEQTGLQLSRASISENPHLRESFRTSLLVGTEVKPLVGAEVKLRDGEVDGDNVSEGGLSKQFPFWQQSPQCASDIPQCPHWLQHAPFAQGLVGPQVLDSALQVKFGVFVVVLVLEVVVTVAPVLTFVEVVVVVSLSCLVGDVAGLTVGIEVSLTKVDP